MDQPKLNGTFAEPPLKTVLPKAIPVLPVQDSQIAIYIYKDANENKVKFFTYIPDQQIINELKTGSKVLSQTVLTETLNSLAKDPTYNLDPLLKTHLANLSLTTQATLATGNLAKSAALTTVNAINRNIIEPVRSAANSVKTAVNTNLIQPVTARAQGVYNTMEKKFVHRGGGTLKKNDTKQNKRKTRKRG